MTMPRLPLLLLACLTSLVAAEPVPATIIVHTDKPGFAIPAEDAKPIIDRLMKGQKIERGYLGVQIGGRLGRVHVPVTN